MTLTACDVEVRSVPEGRSGGEALALEGVFPLLESLLVTEFRVESWCRSIRYSRGAFSETDEPATCNLFDEVPARLDELARTDLERMDSAFLDAGVAVRYGTFEYNPRGQLADAAFWVDCTSPCNYASYQYKRGGIAPDPEPDGDDGVTFVRLNVEWLWYEEE